jgi:hypothetical protein
VYGRVQSQSIKKFKPEVRMIGCAPPLPLHKPLVTGQRQARNQDDAAEAKDLMHMSSSITFTTALTNMALITTHG